MIRFSLRRRHYYAFAIAAARYAIDVTPLPYAADAVSFFAADADASQPPFSPLIIFTEFSPSAADSFRQPLH
jgi:hypothetical protein